MSTIRIPKNIFKGQSLREAYKTIKPLSLTLIEKKTALVRENNFKFVNNPEVTSRMTLPDQSVKKFMSKSQRVSLSNIRPDLTVSDVKAACEQAGCTKFSMTANSKTAKHWGVATAEFNSHSSADSGARIIGGILGKDIELRFDLSNLGLESNGKNLGVDFSKRNTNNNKDGHNGTRPSYLEERQVDKIEQNIDYSQIESKGEQVELLDFLYNPKYQSSRRVTTYRILPRLSKITGR
mmetsp:Transcript_179/g.187  ORF Transcript_179/g.187 Transcript_179/m.187 type:complete len:237 (+) Transcript_179:32-742(+)